MLTKKWAEDGDSPNFISSGMPQIKTKNKPTNPKAKLIYCTCIKVATEQELRVKNVSLKKIVWASLCHDGFIAQESISKAERPH